MEDKTMPMLHMVKPGQTLQCHYGPNVREETVVRMTKNYVVTSSGNRWRKDEGYIVGMSGCWLIGCRRMKLRLKRLKVITPTLMLLMWRWVGFGLMRLRVISFIVWPQVLISLNMCGYIKAE
jgi:hypothetical protein